MLNVKAWVAATWPLFIIVPWSTFEVPSMMGIDHNWNGLLISLVLIAGYVLVSPILYRSSVRRLLKPGLQPGIARCLSGWLIYLSLAAITYIATVTASCVVAAMCGEYAKIRSVSHSIAVDSARIEHNIQVQTGQSVRSNKTQQSVVFPSAATAVGTTTAETDRMIHFDNLLFVLERLPLATLLWLPLTYFPYWISLRVSLGKFSANSLIEADPSIKDA